MAYLQERGGWWHLRFRDSNGKQRSRALKTRSRREAKKALAEFELGGIAAGERLTFGAAWERFLTEKRGTVAEATEKNYQTAGKRVFLPVWKQRKLDTITPSDIQTLLGDLVEAGRSPRSANVIRNLLSGFYHWAERSGVHRGNPVKQTERMKLGRLPIRTISPEQATLLIKHTEPEHRIAAALMYLCALRIGELRALTFNDFSSSGKWLRVNKSVYRTGTRAQKETGEPFTPTKSARGERIIPLSPVAVVMLTEWRKQRSHRERAANRFELMFPGEGGGVMSEARFRTALRKAGEKAAKEWEKQIAPAKEKGDSAEPWPPKIFPHLLRHGGARAWVASGLTLPEAMYLLGHSSVDQSRIYSEWSVADDTRAATMQAAFLGGDFGSKAGIDSR